MLEYKLVCFILDMYCVDREYITIRRPTVLGYQFLLPYRFIYIALYSYRLYLLVHANQVPLRSRFSYFIPFFVTLSCHAVATCLLCGIRDAFAAHLFLLSELPNDSQESDSSTFSCRSPRHNFLAKFPTRRLFSSRRKKCRQRK